MTWLLLFVTYQPSKILEVKIIFAPRMSVGTSHLHLGKLRCIGLYSYPKKMLHSVITQLQAFTPDFWESNYGVLVNCTTSWRNQCSCTVLKLNSRMRQVCRGCQIQLPKADIPRHQLYNRAVKQVTTPLECGPQLKQLPSLRRTQQRSPQAKSWQNCRASARPPSQRYCVCAFPAIPVRKRVSALLKGTKSRPYYDDFIRGLFEMCVSIPGRATSGSCESPPKCKQFPYHSASHWHALI